MTLKTLINFGVSDPLMLGLDHPLKDRLMTLKSSPKSPKFLRGISAVALIIGGLALTTPTTYADSHPEPEVKTKSKSKSVWTVTNDNDGNKRYVITQDDGETEGYVVDSRTGQKTPLSASEIEKRLSDMPDVPKPPTPPKPPKFPRGVTMSKVFADIGEEGDEENVIVLENWGEIAEFAGLENLKSLESLKHFKSLKDLKNLRGMIDEDAIEAWAEDFSAEMEVWGEAFGEDMGRMGETLAKRFEDGNTRIKVMINDEDGMVRSITSGDIAGRIRSRIDDGAVEAQLRSVREQLKQTERLLAREDRPKSSELATARKELANARKALKDAERAMRDAQREE